MAGETTESDAVSFQIHCFRTSLMTWDDSYRGSCVRNKHEVYKGEIWLTIWPSHKDLKMYRRVLIGIHPKELKTLHTDVYSRLIHN